MKPEEDKKSICESCGSDFSCSASNGRCWCFDVEIAQQALLQIEKKYGDCLCLACLENISANFADQDFTAVEDSL